MEKLMHENQHLQARLSSIEQHSNVTAHSTPATIVVAPGPGAPAPARLITPAKPDTYNGSRRVSADVYLFNLKTYFKATGVVQEEQQINFIAAQLRDSAATWWRRICATEATKPDTWQEFESAFIKQFTPVASKETARYALHAMKQRGTAVGYCEAFSTCLLQFEDGDVSEGEQLFMFMCGLNKELQQQVRMMRPKTLDEAMSYAVQIEAENRNYNRDRGNGSSAGRGGGQTSAYQHRSSFPRPGNNQHGAAPMELGSLGAGSNDEKANGWQDEPHDSELNAVGSGPARRLTPDQVKEYMRKGICFICSKPNHLARHCPNRTTKPQAQQRPTNY
jgi:hypothetical protein